MIKSSTLLKRKNGMSVEEFQRYWKDVHAPIASKVPGVRRYIQCHTLPGEYQREAAPDFDGVAEMWWDDEAAFKRAQESSEFKAMVADSANFVGESQRYLENEAVLVDAYPLPEHRGNLVKYIAMLKLKEGVPIATFQDHWRNVHGPINVENIKGMKRYVQSHLLPSQFEGANPPPFGGFPEAWFESPEAMRNAPPRDPNARRDTNWQNVCSGQLSVFTKEVPIIE